jgi:hypothetical protein
MEGGFFTSTSMCALKGATIVKIHIDGGSRAGLTLSYIHTLRLDSYGAMDQTEKRFFLGCKTHFLPYCPESGNFK